MSCVTKQSHLYKHVWKVELIYSGNTFLKREMYLGGGEKSCEEKGKKEKDHFWQEAVCF